MKWTKLAPDCESVVCLEFVNLVDCDSSACLQIDADQTSDFVLVRESARPREMITTTRANLSAVIMAAKNGKLDHLIVGD